MKSRCVFMCNGCDKVRGWNATGWICSVYYQPWKTMWAREGKKCPFNQGEVKQTKLFQRVGQQKGQRGKRNR